MNVKIISLIILGIICATIFKAITCDLDILWAIMQGIVYTFYASVGYIIYKTIKENI